MEYETIIGLEVHAQLLTKSKMFCRCSADYASAPPNTHVCPVCLGMPGVLPTINKQAIEYAIMTALALNCSIPEHTRFDRKNYPYPDLMKGYQISQYDNPLSSKGWLTIEVNGKTRRIGITRVHQEEDVAKLFHRTDPTGETYSLVDVNRAGVPLMEIVSEPDMRSPEEAREYLMKLHSILQYLGVSTGNMEEGSFRCDANVSIRPAGSAKLLSKVEVKNMNSFKAVYRALAYEVERQRKVVNEGGSLVQETRGWVEEKGATVSQRSKEQAHDYRYFPEPDLPPLAVSRQWVEEIKSRLPELPDARRERFISQLGLSRYDANLLTATRAMAGFFEGCLNLMPQGVDRERKAKTVANWLLGEFSRLLNATNAEVKDAKVEPVHLVEMFDLIDKGTLSTKMAKEVFEEMFHSGKSALAVVQEKGLVQVSDSKKLVFVIDEVVSINAKAVVDYKQGKENALRFLVGQVMKRFKGQANPQMVNELLKKKLNGN
ncbi:MAG: aspartyl/glutamyl-tRNA amidotransferase subunit B [Chloroflexi bacterium RBG_13_52_14]|nr:MAG: aspartyl/glutamyl-tRNA amidotransferase subunit B [Chloroflexi bacterium RBG_13_52_14]